MKKNNFTRRRFVATITTASLTAALSNTIPTYWSYSIQRSRKIGDLGGSLIRKNGGIIWTAILADKNVIASIVKTTKSGIWSRIQSATGTVPTFEKEYANLMGTKFCVGTGSGTQALSICVEAPGNWSW